MPLELPPGPLATGLLVSRARRPSLATRLVLVVLVALVAGLASAGLIAAQRADQSVDRFVDWYRPEDRIVVTAPGKTPHGALELLRSAGHRPEVDDRLLLSVIVVRAHLPGGDASRGAMVAEAPLNRLPSDMARFRVLRGRLADPERWDEVVIDEDLARLVRAGVGDRIALDLYAADQIDVIGNGRMADPRATVEMRVSGIVRRPQDLEHDPESQPDNLAEFNDAFLATTPAFWSRYGPDLANYGFHELVRLKPNATAPKRFIASFNGRDDMTSFPADVFHDSKVVHRAVRTEAIALLVFSLVVAVVGFVLVGTQIRRAVALDPDDRTTLHALGVGRTELAIADVLRAAPIVVGGALASVLVAVIAAPRMAFGVSRRAELGGSAGSGILIALLFALVVMVGAMSAVALSARAARREDGGRELPRHEGRLLAWMTRRGLPSWSVAGVRMAKPARGRRGAAARSAQVAIGVGVALLVATLVFGANLHHLVTTPAARGWTWDLEVGNFSESGRIPAARRALAYDPDVASFTGYGSENLPVAGHAMDVLGIEDPAVADLPVFDGRLPSTRGEIALSQHTLHELHRKVGEDVTLNTGLGPPRTFHIVGVTLGPGAVDQTLDIQRGGVVRWDDLRSLLPQSVVVNRFLVRFHRGLDPEVAMRPLRTQFGRATVGPSLTTGLASVQRVQPLLVLFAVVVLVLAGGALVHALRAAIRRHRRELAVLKALGHDRRQTGGTVVFQSVAIATRAMIIGVPVGLIVGRWAWTFAASTIGVAPTVSYPLGVLLAMLGVLAAAAITGLPSAGRASRVPVAEALRTE